MVSAVNFKLQKWILTTNTICLTNCWLLFTDKWDTNLFLILPKTIKKRKKKLALALLFHKLTPFLIPKSLTISWICISIWFSLQKLSDSEIAHHLDSVSLSFRQATKTRRFASSPNRSALQFDFLFSVFDRSLSILHRSFGFIYRRFGNVTLRFLDSLLVSKGVKSLVEIRCSLTQLLKSESLSIIQSINAECIHDKLLVLEFFVSAFSIVGDL
jgi:hypothetical protein